MTPAEQLSNYRKSKGYTQADMAQRLGITQQSYSYFENGRRRMTLDFINKVLKATGMDLANSLSRIGESILEYKTKIANLENQLVAKDTIIKKQEEEIAFLRSMMQAKFVSNKKSQ